MNAIDVRNLTKKFDDVTAVDGISFTVGKGELFGLLGPNGAGKTTTINMLSTLLRPTSGTAEVAGIEVTRDRAGVRSNIGIVFQEPALDGRLTGRENLEFHALMYDMPRAERDAKISEVMELVELSDKKNTYVDKYSGGMKRRLEIARGLIHRPEVLFLDEPTLGLDAQTRRHIWDYIRMLNRREGVTIILTTHYMEEADFLCDRVAIMDKGRIVQMDKPGRLKDILGGDVVSLRVRGDGSLKEFRRILKGTKWIRRMKRRNGQLELVVKHGERRIPELMDMAREQGLQIRAVSLNKPSLEDVFLHFTGRKLAEKEGGNSNGAIKPAERKGGGEWG